MKRVLFLLFLNAVAVAMMAQHIVVSGTVTDEQTGKPVAQASVTAPSQGVSVVTNDDGYFTLKAEELPEAVSISHVGYKTRSMRLSANQLKDLNIKLKPTTVNLSEIVVWPSNPRKLVDLAISRIGVNYSRHPELFSGFYRETAMKRQHYIYVAEGVVDMYKSAYNRESRLDGVAIRKGRRLLRPKRGDTLSMKVMGGPVQPILLDVVKNPDILLNGEELNHYDLEMETLTEIDGRQQFVVKLSPAVAMPYALYYGHLYIDRETLAFTRVELSLDMSDREKATQFMLVRKPAGVRFRPKELTLLIDYKYENGVSRISYVRNTFRFNCDWKRKLFSTSFTAFCEMVVTGRNEGEAKPIKGRSTFDSRDLFYDRVEYFRDPAFWEDYNIIEPSESLDKAVDKLLKKYPAHIN